MPKKRNRKCQAESLNVVESENDDESNISEYSSSSDKLNPLEVETETSVELNLKIIQELTEKLFESKLNVSLLNQILKIFQSSFLNLDSEWGYLDTLFEGLERNVKKCKFEEQLLATKAFGLYLIQLGPDFATLWHNKIINTFSPFYKEKGIHPYIRAESLKLVALCYFSSCDINWYEYKKTMDSFENIFKNSYLKGDGNHPSISEELMILHSASLDSWSLLFTKLPVDKLIEISSPVLTKFHQLLKSQNVDMRISAGFTLVVIFERIRNEINPRFKGNAYSDMIEELELLSKDGVKYRSKLERKKQRRTFREIINAVQSENVYIPVETMEINKSEQLVIETWVTKFKYDYFCRILGSGMLKHIRENCFVREIFELGSPKLAINVEKSKIPHKQKYLANQANSKLLKQTRQEGRTKRMEAQQFSD